MDRSVLPIEIDRSWPGSSTPNKYQGTTFFRTDCVIEKHGVEYDSKDVSGQPCAASMALTIPRTEQAGHP
jgi:hypothetical protein